MPVSVKDWVSAHPLYIGAATERDSLAKRVAELEILIAAADGLHRVAMAATEKQLGLANVSREELAERLRAVRETNAELRTEVRDVKSRLSTELGASDLCA